MALVAAALVAAGLALAAQPAAAAPAAAQAATGTGGSADRPEPVDPHRKARSGTGNRGQTNHVRRNVPNPLLKDVLSEAEATGPEPHVSALCQEFIGQPNPYHDPAPNVDQIVGDTIVPVGTQAGCPSAQNETTIAVNPYNARNIVAGANDYRVFNSRENRNDSSGWAYTSKDGGRTWANVVAPKLTYQTGATAPLSYMDSAGDPSIAFGPLNTVYYANIAFSRVVPTDKSQMASAITMSVSHDGGQTFADPVIIKLDGVLPDGTPTPTLYFNDKEWVTADPFSGTVYVTWSRFRYDAAGNQIESPIVVARSTDFGRTWSAPVQVAPSLEGFSGGITPYDQGSNPRIGRDGTLYIAYEASVCRSAACDAPSDHDATVVATSTDHGRTFTNEEIAINYDFPATLTGENFRLNSYPQTGYDPVTDTLWVTWADDRNGEYDTAGNSVRTNGDNFVVSLRRGHRHSAVYRVGTSADEFFGAIAVLAGRVAVSYYTRAYDPNGIGLDYAYSVAWGARINGAGVRRITTETSNPQIQFVAVAPDGTVLQGVFIGDYSAMAIGTDFRLHPCWTDFRGRPGVTTPNQDAYTQSISALS